MNSFKLLLFVKTKNELEIVFNLNVTRNTNGLELVTDHDFMLNLTEFESSGLRRGNLDSLGKRCPSRKGQNKQTKSLSLTEDNRHYCDFSLYLLIISKNTAIRIKVSFEEVDS